MTIATNKEYAQCTFLIKTSNIFNVPIVIDLIAYWLGTPEAVELGHARPAGEVTRSFG